jgi:alpha-ketoglutarate-dependent 2,4-dichlorophenoxyacetate dioxygenase
VAISVKPLHPLFGAEIGQVDIGPPLDESTFAAIRAAFEEYSLLLFRDQELDDDKQIRVQQALRATRNDGQGQSGRRHLFRAAIQSRHRHRCGEPA